MNYAKPQIALLASAQSAIQNHVKDIQTGFDSDPSVYLTLGAYEADE
jgi:hypothetical protein